MRKPVAFLLAFLMIVMMLSVFACDFGGSTTTEDPGTTPTTPTTPSTPTTEPTVPPTEPTVPPTTEPTVPPEPVVKDIELNFSSTDPITVAAGATVALPTVTATDYDGTDLTADIEIEDPYEKGTIADNTFKGLIAGDHMLYYYVEVADEEAEDGVRYAEYTLKVTVTPATENTYDTEGYNDVANMTNYGIFKDGFEAGKKSPLGSAIGDSNNATYITGTSEAIEGNSLVIDFNRTAGSALNAVFLSAFNNNFHRGVATTYKVKFSYKIITADDNTGDVYFGLSWDGSNGLNGQFVKSGAQVGEVYTYETQFSSAVVPDNGGNAYFIFFKLSGSPKDIKIAIDNFEVETVELTPVNEVIPTGDQLTADGGFTWDFGVNGALSTNGETVAISKLDDTIKDAMAENDHFHNNVMKLINADGHLFSGLTRNNLIAEKKIILDIYYYAVNDGGFHLIMMGDSGNPTLSIDNETVSGKIKHAHYEGVIPAGWNQLNIYGQGNGNFEIYIGEITVQLVDNVVEVGKTPLGHVIGEYTYTQAKRAGFGGNAAKGVYDYDGYDFGDVNVTNQMGSAPQKITYSGVTADWNIEWFNANGEIFESGYWYRITMVYYVVKYEGGVKLMYNIDNAKWIAIGEGDYMSEGYHVSSIKYKAESNSGFFSIYDKKADDAAALSAEYYIKHVKVELINEDDPVTATTGKGHQIGNYSVTQSSRSFGNKTEGNWTVTAYDNYEFGEAAAKMGTSATKFTLNGVNNATMEWFRPQNNVLENGYKYAITLRYYVVSWEGGTLTYNFDNAKFPPIVTNPTVGYHETTITWDADKDVDFFSFYIPTDSTVTATLYIADVTISLIG